MVTYCTRVPKPYILVGCRHSLSSLLLHPIKLVSPIKNNSDVSIYYIDMFLYVSSFATYQQTMPNTHTQHTIIIQVSDNYKKRRRPNTKQDDSISKNVPRNLYTSQALHWVPSKMRSQSGLTNVP